MERVYSWWVKYESRMGFLFTILGFCGFGVGSGFSALASTGREIVYALSFALFCVGGLLISLAYCVRLGRKAKYAEVLPHLRAAVGSIVEESLRTQHTVEEKKKALTKVMDELARAFSILTGSKCRCCLKLARNPSKKNAMEVSTFCRSPAERDEGGTHPIEHNTDFNDLYQDPLKPWFVGNYLPAMAKDGHYGNTSKEWKKKYVATVVWPIRRPTGNPQSPASLLGFLCVDTKKAEAFSEAFDYPVGAIVADALCPFLTGLANSIEAPTQSAVTATRAPLSDGRGEEPAAVEQPAAAEPGAPKHHEH